MAALWNSARRHPATLAPRNAGSDAIAALCPSDSNARMRPSTSATPQLPSNTPTWERGEWGSGGVA